MIIRKPIYRYMKMVTYFKDMCQFNRLNLKKKKKKTLSLNQKKMVPRKYQLAEQVHEYMRIILLQCDKQNQLEKCKVSDLHIK
jgi:hypothetical protein